MRLLNQAKKAWEGMFVAFFIDLYTGEFAIQRAMNPIHTD